MSLTLDQIEQALDEVNMFYASRFYGREPTALEAIIYYANHLPMKVRTFDVVPNLFSQEEETETEQFRKYHAP